jgi:hypothetical protein
VATNAMQRLGLVILLAVLLTGLLAWRLQASGPISVMFDSSPPPPQLSYRISLPIVIQDYTSARPHNIYLPMVVR